MQYAIHLYTMDSTQNISKTQDNLHLLLGLSGSVASIKLPYLINQIKLAIPQAIIRIVLTQNALHFIDTGSIDKSIEVFTDQDEWSTWKQRGDPVLHIELRKWADILLIAPLTANTMAKIVNGISDNLLTCIVRAWDFECQGNPYMLNKLSQPIKLLRKPIIVAPAMNTFMYNNPITAKHINYLEQSNIVVLETVEKTLMCGDKGLGAMMETEDIIKVVISVLQVINPTADKQS